MMQVRDEVGHVEGEGRRTRRFDFVMFEIFIPVIPLLAIGRGLVECFRLGWRACFLINDGLGHIYGCLEDKWMNGILQGMTLAMTGRRKGG
jgi:hypothetical protein